MAGREPRDNSCSLHLSNVTPDTRPDDLYEIFEKYGKVKDVYIPRDYYTGHPRGFAYVQFFDDESAESAYRKNEYVTLRGQKMTVDWAKGGRKSAVEMRTRIGDRSDRRRRRSFSRSPPRRRSGSRDRYNDRRRSPDRGGRYNDRGGRYNDRDDRRDDRGGRDDRGRYDDRDNDRDNDRGRPDRRRSEDAGSAGRDARDPVVGERDNTGAPGFEVKQEYVPIPAAERSLPAEGGW